MAEEVCSKLKKRLEEVTRREQNVQRQAKQLKQAKKELDVRNNALTRNENSVRFLVSVLKQQPTRKMTNQELLLDKLSTVKDFVKTYDEGKLEKELGKSLDQSIQEIKTFSNPSKVPQQGLNLLNQTKDIKH